MENKSDIVITPININGKSMLGCHDCTPGKKPVLFLYHRLLQSKEFELPFAYYLARGGYWVILPDFPGHGDGADGFYALKKYNFDCLFEHIVQAVTDTIACIEYIKQAPLSGMDVTSIGVLGVSLGGMVALTAGYISSMIHWVIAVNSCVRWYELVARGSFNSFRFFSVHKHIMNTETVKPIIDKYDPIHNIDRYGNKPVLILSGMLDRTFPPDIIEPFYLKLKEYNAQKNNESSDNNEKISWKVYTRTGHDLTYEMVMDIIQWLNKWSKRSK